MFGTSTGCSRWRISYSGGIDDPHIQCGVMPVKSRPRLPLFIWNLDSALLPWQVDSSGSFSSLSILFITAVCKRDGSTALPISGSHHVFKVPPVFDGIG